MFYIGEEGRGDIVIDCSYTKFLSDMKNLGTAKYIQNIGAWTARIEYHYTQEYLQPSEYRPKIVEYELNDTKWTKFTKKPKIKKIIDPTKLKTLIAFDSSGSVNGKTKYFERLKKIIEKFYKEDRGDQIYRWDSSKKKLNYQEVMNIIDGKIGDGGTSSHLIAEIAKEENINNFKHLVIVTDGEVDKDEILKSDKLMKEYKIKYDYVTSYIIHTSDSCDKSVGAAYCRDCPNVTIYIDQNNIEHPQASLTSDDLKAFENLKTIKTEVEFINDFDKILMAVKAKTLGAASIEVKEVLDQLKKRLSNRSNQFNEKWNKLYKMASEGNDDMKLTVC